MLKKQLVSILVISMIVFLPLASAAANEENFAQRKQLPIVELVDLFLDGSINPIRINLTNDFDFITKIRFHFDYESAVWIPSNFAASDPLENGTATISGNKPLFDGGNLTQNDRLFLVGDTATFIQDDKAPKNTHIFGGVNFFEMIPPYGLSYSNNNSLYFIVQDNITAAVYAIDKFVVLIEGFEWEDTRPAVNPLANPFETLNDWFLWVLSTFGVWIVAFISLAILLLMWKRFT